MKRRDIILIVVLLVIAGASYLVLQMTQKSGAQVVVTVDSEEVWTASLDEDQTYTIPESDGKNTLEIKNGKVSMTSADCPDQICVNHKAISKSGETIVCLPHKVVISVESEEESDVDMIAQ